MDVRFERKNGHDADVTRCLLMTQGGRFIILVMEFGPSLRWESSIPMPATVRLTVRQKIAVLIDYNHHGLGVLPE